ncbi:MAG: hypoxanthine phosphoribosyltransferase [Phycisphaeraceae bacterium]|nr:hypoxanthine phosphoribosyltransferase [Phycisphaeraceae bacterium]MCW5753346.1 hypoxanthine phosphoribosyltransferase [Phycisphaeraceae bacterium]
MLRDIDAILIDRDRIADRVRAMGEQIAADLLREIGPGASAGQIVFIPILTGAVVFVADLIRHIPFKLSLGVVAVSSYPGRSLESKGAAIRGDLPRDLAGKHVVIVDDVLDSGRTLALIRDLVLEQQPASLRIAVLLSKDVAREARVDAEYVGFSIPDAFVVGYGLDYDGYYRNLPDVATLKPEAIEQTSG